MKKIFIILFMIFAVSFINENYAQNGTKKVNIRYISDNMTLFIWANLPFSRDYNSKWCNIMYH